MVSSAMAQTPIKSDKTCYDSAQVKKLAEFKMECDLSKANYKAAESSLQACLYDTQCSKGWSEDKTVVGAGFLASFLVGVIVAYSVKK